MPKAHAPLPTQTLRLLNVDPLQHPRGAAFIGAASGLLCRQGRVYVVADDEHHLAVFDSLHQPGSLHRVFAGDLPAGKKARKRLKPDLECLLWWPAPAPAAAPALLALGSGSKAGRDRAVLLPLGTDGKPEPAPGAVQQLELAPLYEPLRERFGRINIEGAFLLADELVLLQRGGRDAINASLHYRIDDLRALIGGNTTPRPPRRIVEHHLGTLQGVALGFTDAAALPQAQGGGWVFTAVAEDSDNAVADGDFCGAVVGIVDAQGECVAMRPLAQAAKVEGIDVQLHGGQLRLCMSTDADDPEVPSQLLLALW
jgi:hypothetical protein